jgi:hypothetical protein
MKTLLAICMIVVAPFVSASAPATALPPAPTAVSGEVLEVRDVESYTYLRLKTRDGETWAAVSRAPVKTGAKVTLENVTVMKNFESRSLQRTFPTILFGSLAGAAGNGMAPARSAPDTPDARVPRASGPNARTVAEIVTQSAELKDKPVLVRGKVVKYNAAIMGKNWIHLRDGSGSAANGSNDLIVTTASQAKTGDVVTVKGVVRTDKDFGSGYAYKVLVEDATLQP